MDTIEKTSRRVKQVIDNELSDLLKWAGSQSPQENEFTLSTWVPRHLRGLLKFVNDLRLGEGKGQNGRRIQEEISKIDKAIARGLSSYDRKKYIAKVTYMRILGVDAPVGYQEGLRLMASDSIWDKQVGYLYVSLVFDNKPDMQRLIVQCLQNDLQQEALSQPYVHQLALNLTAHYQNAEIAHHISHILDRFLCSTDSISGTRQSAALCQDVVVTIDPDTVTNGRWFQQVFSWLESGSCDTVASVLGLIRTLTSMKRDEFGVCVPQLLVYFQDSIKKLQCNSVSTTYHSRISPQGFADLLQIFGEVSLSRAEENTLMECVKQLLLYFAAARDPPRFKKVTDELEAGFTERPMFGDSYEWLKRAPSYRQETVVFAALCLVFKRLSSLELMKEGLDYYARYLYDSKAAIRRWTLNQVMQYVYTSEAGFALLKSHERWSVSALMIRLKEEPCDDIRNDLCGLCFKLTTLPEESSVLCQNILEFVRMQINGLNVRRLSEQIIQLHENSLISFQKFVYMVIEFADNAPTHISTKALHLTVIGTLSPSLPAEIAGTICLLLEDKVTKKFSDTIVQLAVIIIGAMQHRNGGSEQQVCQIVHLFCDLCQRPGLSPLTKAYLILYISLFATQMNNTTLRSRAVGTIRHVLDKPSTSREYQAYQSFMLVDDTLVSSTAQLEALRFISSVVDKPGDESHAPSVRPRPRPSSIAGDISHSVSQEKSVFTKAEGRKADNSLPFEYQSFHWDSAQPAGPETPPNNPWEVEAVWDPSPADSHQTLTKKQNRPWSTASTNRPWSTASTEHVPPAWTQSGISTATSAVSGSGSDFLDSSSLDALSSPWSNNDPSNPFAGMAHTGDDYGFADQPFSEPQRQLALVPYNIPSTDSHTDPPRFSESTGHPEFDPLHPDTKPVLSPTMNDVNLMDFESMPPDLQALYGKGQFQLRGQNIANQSSSVNRSPPIPPRPNPANRTLISETDSAHNRKRTTTPPSRSGWSFTNPWRQFDLNSVVNSLNLSNNGPNDGNTKGLDS